MAKPKKILVAYDGSPHSKAALDWALLLGSIEKAELDVIKVFEPVSQSFTKLDYDFSDKTALLFGGLENEDRRMLEEVKTFCEGCCKMKVHVDVLRGHVASALLDYARQKGAGLIVTGTQGHGVLDEIFVGSVANSLVSLAKMPVLVVKEKQAPARLQKILVAYDGSEFAKAALELALDLGKLANAEIVALKVAELPSYTELFSMKASEPNLALRLKARLEEQNHADRLLLEGAKSIAWFKGMEITTELLPNQSFADAILRYAGEHNADMIVAGTLGHGLLEGLLIGSVTRKLISLSKLPVLVVKK